MHENYMLAGSGEQMIELDDKALSAIVGGDGPGKTILGQLISLLWDCVKTGVDDVIDAAKEGYSDARG
jgi:hypothetical protein